MILKEYAIDPEVIDSLENAKYWFSLFSLDQGRQISCYPNKWKSKVYESVGKSFKAKQYVENRLLNMNKKVLRKNNRMWNNELNWVENAVEEDTRKNFCAIISKEKISKSKKIFMADEIDDTHECMKAEHIIPIKRDLDGVTTWIVPLLEQADKLAFVDPFFNPEKIEYIKPLERILKILANRINRINKFEIHFIMREDNKAGTFDYVKSKFENNILPLIPSNSFVSIKRIKKEENHNRYILVNGLIGAHYGAGFQIMSSGSAIDDEITRMTEKTNQDRWKKFVLDIGEPDFSFNT